MKDLLFDVIQAGVAEERKKRYYVYILWDYSNMPYENSTRIKIGVSTNPEKRCAGIITQAGINYGIMFAYFECNNNKSETNTHNLFSEYRGIGEWFDMSPFVAIENIMEPNFFNSNFTEAYFGLNLDN